MSDSVPRYQLVKAYIMDGIERMLWPEHHRVPSENELVEACKVSRMTARRALDELTESGILYRVQGRGTFVAPRKLQSPVLKIRNIAEEVAERGGHYSNELLLLQKEICPDQFCNLFGMDEPETVYHSIMVHQEDRQPIQIEQRYVNPASAPDYLKQDYGAITPNVYLSQVAPLSEARHVIEATAADQFLRKTLQLAEFEPVLVINRTTWSGEQLVSHCQLFHPASRFRLTGSFKSEHQLTEL